MLKKIPIFVFLFLQVCAYSQTYYISVENMDSAIVMTNKALKKIDEKKLDEAYSILVETIRIDSALRPAYFQFYRIGLLSNEYAGKVINYLKKGKRIFSDDDELIFYLGEIYRINSDLKNAIKEYNAAIKYSKINGEDFHLTHYYHFCRGNCYFKQNQLDSAIVDYSYTLKLKPGYPPALLNRGMCFYKQKKSDQACADWNKCIELGYTSANVYLGKYCQNKK